MGWELLAGLVGAFAYYVTRYEKNYRGLYEKTLNFVEYLQWEWLALLKGVCGFVLLWALWSYAADPALLVLGRIFDALSGVTAPEMNPFIALVIGGLGKPIWDRIPRIVEYFKKKAK